MPDDAAAAWRSRWPRHAYVKCMFAERFWHPESEKLGGGRVRESASRWHARSVRAGQLLDCGRLSHPPHPVKWRGQVGGTKSPSLDAAVGRSLHGKPIPIEIG